ncbi:hypothetical protein GCM10019016_104340 [Streptomyces prasinosporus]|uniref:Uncharacterized protein n=1 Tax=Streptomyces prasinosporus TaxID=68256 RepID=A0ABP6U7A9_9ACTN
MQTGCRNNGRHGVARHYVPQQPVPPLAAGGTTAHVLAIDYALRPVLASMSPARITPGWFVLDEHIDVRRDDGIVVEPGARQALNQVIDRFAAAFSERRPLRATA